MADQGPSFKPSQVEILPSPLIATMGRAETESAAALIVHTCAANGDAWQAVSTDMVVRAVRDAGPDSTIGQIVRNPFLAPDFVGLVAAGFATRSAVDGATSYALTENGIARLGRWVRRG